MWQVSAHVEKFNRLTTRMNNVYRLIYPINVKQTSKHVVYELALTFSMLRTIYLA